MEASLPQLFNHWFLQTLAVLVTALLLPGLRVTSIFGALAMAVAISFVNATVWNAGLFAELPTGFSPHTFTVLVANGFIFWALVKLLPGIESNGILPCIVGPIAITIISVLLNTYCRDVDWMALGTQALEWLKSFRDMLMGTAKPPTPV